MKIAYTMARGRGDTDSILYGLAGNLAARGLRCCGIVQINTERTDASTCDMDVQVLPREPVLRISQDLGRGARGCRLDPAALETAVGLVAAQLEHGADLLIVNKFGKHEAEGRGFRSIIAQALSLEIPVLVGANALNLAAFLDFTDGMAVQVPSEKDPLLAWVENAVGAKAKVA